MNRNNTERRAAKECRNALSIVRRMKGRRSATMDEGRAEGYARNILSAWRYCYPAGIPGDGEFHDGIPAE